MDEGAESNTDVAKDNELRILLLVKRAARVEVVDTTAHAILLALTAPLTLTLVEVVTSDVGQKVIGPSDELLTKKHRKGINGSLLGELRYLMDQPANAVGVILPGTGDKDHISLHVGSSLVVLAVRNLPTEVRNEE